MLSLVAKFKDGSYAYPVFVTFVTVNVNVPHLFFKLVKLNVTFPSAPVVPLTLLE